MTPPKPPTPPSPAAEPPRATTQALVAAGAQTEDVRLAERAIAAALLAVPAVRAGLGGLMVLGVPEGEPERALPVELVAPIRRALLTLAAGKLQEGRQLCVSRLWSASRAAIPAYWRACAAIEHEGGPPSERPTLRAVMAMLAAHAETHHPDDVRDALAVHACPLAPDEQG